MSRQTKWELVKRYAKEYRRGAKAEKTRILAIVVEATGYSRKHAIALLNHPPPPKRRAPRKRGSRYAMTYDVLVRIWAVSNFLCGKRLQPFLPKLINTLKRFNEITISDRQEQLLLRISAATIDRMLAPARKGLNPKGRATTKPGTLLKRSIAVRTFADWDDAEPGFVEVDLVAHCGSATAGEYVNTLDMTDVASGWTVCEAFMGRSEKFCVAAIEQARRELPFKLLGLDSDNDAPFINSHLKRYCERNQIKFTRSRPNKKNDQCHVEQKNWDVVRKMIGYARFDTYEQMARLNGIYNTLGLYHNYFQPSRKLVSKHREGAKVTKTYDTAQTPCERLLAHPNVHSAVKKTLRDTEWELNPAQLLQEIQRLVYNLCHETADGTIPSEAS